MKIAYVCEEQATNVKSWSGINYFFRRGLAEGAELYTIDNLVQFRRPYDKLVKWFYNAQGKRYHISRNESLLRAYAARIESQLQADTDAILSPSSLPLTFVGTSLPKFCYSDATFHSMLGYYTEFTRLSSKTLRDGERLEQLALDGVATAFFASEWAARSAIEHYGLSPSKVKVVPFGANLHEETSREKIVQAIRERSTTTCQLLFVGVDYVRKGLDRALRVTEELQRRGIDAVLHYVGSDRLPEKYRRPCLRLHGFLNKSDERARQTLDSLWRSSHFLMVPSQAECAGIVYAEASAHGMPSIAQLTGGVGTMVQSEINGRAFPTESADLDYVDFIEKLWSDRSAYERLCQSSFQYYAERLNWSATGRTIREAIQAIVKT